MLASHLLGDPTSFPRGSPGSCSYVLAAPCFPDQAQHVPIQVTLTWLAVTGLPARGQGGVASNEGTWCLAGRGTRHLPAQRKCWLSQHPERSGACRPSSSGLHLDVLIYVLVSGYPSLGPDLLRSAWASIQTPGAAVLSPRPRLEMGFPFRASHCWSVALVSLIPLQGH